MRGLERGGATLSAGILALSATSAVAVPEESKESVEAPASVIEQASEAYRERDEMQESLDAASEAQVLATLREEFAGRSMLVTLSRPALAREFDRVLVMEQGRLAQQGEFEELRREEGPLAPLLAAE